MGDITGKELYAVRKALGKRLGDKVITGFNALDLISGAEAEVINGVTPGTAAASKALVLDANGRVSSFGFSYQVYADATARDAANSSPRDGFTVYNAARNTTEVYDSEWACWVGVSESDRPVAVDLMERYYHLVPGLHGVCKYGDNVFSTTAACYFDGERLKEAALSVASEGAYAMDRSDSGIISATASTLYRSSNGTAAYASVLSSGGGTWSLGNALADCGNNDIFYVSYNESVKSIWYSSDGGANWGDNHPDYDDGDAIITAAAGSVRHFHGCNWDADASKLYILTGDTDDEVSVLVCDDIADLAENPSTWSDRWGLDDATRSTLDTDYVPFYNRQKYRLIQILFPGDGYGYCSVDGVVDDEDFGEGTPVWRFDTSDYSEEWIYCHPPAEAADDYVPGHAAGTPWLWHELPSGRLIFTAASEWSSSLDDYRPGGDQYARVYALTDDRRQALEVWRIRRPDYADPSGIKYPIGICDLYDGVYITSNVMPCVYLAIGNPAEVGANLTYNDLFASTYNGISNDVLARHTAPPRVNYIRQGRALASVSEWDESSAGVVSRETTIVDDGEIGSIEVDPTQDAGNASYAEFAITGDRLAALQGNLLTVTCSVRGPDGLSNDQNPRLWVNYTGGSNATYAMNLANKDIWDGANFYEIWQTFYLPHGTTALTIRLYALYTGTGGPHDSIYWSNVRLGIGPISLARSAPVVVDVE